MNGRDHTLSRRQLLAGTAALAARVDGRRRYRRRQRGYHRPTAAASQSGLHARRRRENDRATRQAESTPRSSNGSLAWPRDPLPRRRHVSRHGEQSARGADLRPLARHDRAQPTWTASPASRKLRWRPGASAVLRVSAPAVGHVLVSLALPASGANRAGRAARRRGTNEPHSYDHDVVVFLSDWLDQPPETRRAAASHAAAADRRPRRCASPAASRSRTASRSRSTSTIPATSSTGKANDNPWSLKVRPGDRVRIAVHQRVGVDVLPRGARRPRLAIDRGRRPADRAASRCQTC